MSIKREKILDLHTAYAVQITYITGNVLRQKGSVGVGDKVSAAYHGDVGLNPNNGSWQLTSSLNAIPRQVNQTSLDDKVDLESYNTNAVWEILATSVDKRKVANVDVLSYKLKIQRKHLHEMLTLFVPVLLLTILDLFVFALPNGGDRSGYAVTVFLAFSVYFTIVDTVMPPNSEKVSLFSVYLVIQTCQSTIITILSVLLTKVEFIDESTRIPRFLVFLVRISGASCKRKKPAEVYALEHITEGETSEGNTVEKDLKEITKPTTWTMVTDAVDKIAFIVFTLVFILTAVSFFCVIILVPK
ncbi:uncharacterized protein LOC128555702 [Mercenaria mercenaria]|uniref:uncharacterized protein LOC128555702 n=1 Tax=Mercenaria mercenaria TaxID=6596 RepID=UPI00234EE287|nr:uncharacterized protein LOC128555702 [Mercenaria mercenaria]